MPPAILGFLIGAGARAAAARVLTWLGMNMATMAIAGGLNLKTPSGDFNYKSNKFVRVLTNYLKKFGKDFAVSRFEDIVRGGVGGLSAIYLLIPLFNYLVYEDVRLRQERTHDTGYITTTGFTEALDIITDAIGFMILADVLSGTDVGSDMAEELVSEIMQKAVSDVVEQALKIKTGGYEPDVDEVRETIAEGAIQKPEEIAMQYLVSGINIFSGVAHAYAGLLQSVSPFSLIVRERIQRLFDDMFNLHVIGQAFEAYRRYRGDQLDTMYRVIDAIEILSNKIRNIISDYIDAKISAYVAGVEVPFTDYDKMLDVLETLVNDLEQSVSTIVPCDYIYDDTYANQRIIDLLNEWIGKVTEMLSSIKQNIENKVQTINSLMRAVRQ